MKFCTVTLGCKVNQYEAQGIAGILISRGHVQAAPGAGCDVCIINTCAVTAESSRKSRQAVRRMKKLAPGALVAVCGCLSQLDPREAEALGADITGGSGDRQGFALKIEELALSAARGAGSMGQGGPEAKPPASPCGAEQDGAELGTGSMGQGSPETMPPASPRGAELDVAARGAGSMGQGGGSAAMPPASPRGGARRPAFEELPPGAATGRTRALLKIQDGCDNYCAYCVIPYARGEARSLPLERAAAHARRLDEQGFREIVVTGIEISSYGKDLDGSPSLADAIRTISEAAPRARLRLGSLDPGTITEGFCGGLGAIENLCDHFHLSLQSGCDQTLRRMGRGYGASSALEAISSLRRRFPGCGITADLIAGFPGETEAEFGQTMLFIKAAEFSGMHIFQFSPRNGTKAADMPQQVAKSVKRERARAAALAAEEMAHSFKLGQVGKTLEVLFERERDGYWTGHSRNYLEVAVRGAGEKNSVHNVQIASVGGGLIWGEKN